LFSNEESRMQVIRRMYEKRFPDKLPADVNIEQVRAMEGARVRKAYQEISAATGMTWTARDYTQDSWANADPANRALSAANSCLYGICHAAILSAGYSPAIGFIHVGKMLSFVYDIADLYKTELTVPLAFNVVKEGVGEIERRVRIKCRDMFHESRLMQRILPDIAEVLDAGDDLGESPGELEGRIITLADRAAVGRIPWESEREGEGRTVADGTGEE
jgi:CRISP-associated protein Cas1